MKKTLHFAKPLVLLGTVPYYNVISLRNTVSSTKMSSMH